MVQGNYYITFSRVTVKKWIDKGAVIQRISSDNKARKMGWYFLQEEINQLFPEYLELYIQSKNRVKEKKRPQKRGKSKKKSGIKSNQKNNFFNSNNAKKKIKCSTTKRIPHETALADRETPSAP